MTRHSDVLGLRPGVGNPARQRPLNADSSFRRIEREKDSIDRPLPFGRERLPMSSDSNSPQIALVTQHARCKLRLLKAYIGLRCRDISLEVAQLETLAINEG